MERIKKLVQQLVGNCIRLRAWLQENPRNIAIAAICSVAITATAVLLIRILPYLIVAGLLLWIFSDELKAFFRRFRLPNLEDDEVCFETAKFMHKSICEGKPLDEIAKTPPTVHGIYDNNDYREMYNGVTKLKLRLVRKNRDKDPDCDYQRIVLQDSVNARLADGYLRGYSWAIPANNTVSLLKVATFDYSDLYIYIGILLTNNQACVNAARISDTPTPPQATGDTDPLFVEEDEENEGED